MSRRLKSSTRKTRAAALVLLGALLLVLALAGKATLGHGGTTPGLSPPTSVSGGDSASFDFGDGAADVSYLCSLDGGRYSACSSPRSLTRLADGTHTFSVRAKSPAGRLSDPSSYAWKVTAAKSQAGAAPRFLVGVPQTGTSSRAAAGALTISGSSSKPFYPGTTRPVDLVLANSSDSAVTVKSLTVTVRPATTRAGCDGPTNYGLANPDRRGGSRLTFGQTVTVPAGATKSLSELGIPAADWPQITMRNLPIDQDACANANFTVDFSYSSPPGAPFTPPAAGSGHPTILLQQVTLSIPAGGTARFRITVKNTARVRLTNLRIEDSHALGCARRIGTLAAGATMTYTCTRSHVQSSFENAASLSGKRLNGTRVSASARSTVKVAAPLTPPKLAKAAPAPTSVTAKPAKPRLVAHIAPRTTG